MEFRQYYGLERKHLARELMDYYYMSRCGYEFQNSAGVFSHSACHMAPAVVYGTDEHVVDVHGGWHDAGDYGRYIMPAAKAVADLLLAWHFDHLLFEKIDILGEVKWELEWMLRMQREDGAVYHKVSCSGFCGFISPEMETESLIVSPVSTEATADFAGACAFASIIYRDIDMNFGSTLLSAAERAWQFLEMHERIPFSNPEGITTGEYGTGENLSDIDERFFAAAALYCATESKRYVEWVYGHIFDAEINAELGWIEMGGYGLILLAEFQHDNDAIKLEAEKKIAETAKAIVRNSDNDPFGYTRKEYAWGSNMYLLNDGVIAAFAGIKGLYSHAEKAAGKALAYIFGNNAMGICFVTGMKGLNGICASHPHHRPSEAAGCTMPGMLVGGPAEGLYDPCVENECKDAPERERYIDAAESYSTNEVAIYWNSVLVLLIALLK